MIRMAVAAFAAFGLMGATAFAQSARAPDPDPVTLPDDDNTVVVPGTVERPVELPNGDTRSARQRSSDRSKYDRCVMKIRDRDDDSPNANPVGTTPEEYCSSRLGMRDRNAMPDSRQRKN